MPSDESSDENESPSDNETKKPKKKASKSKKKEKAGSSVVLLYGGLLKGSSVKVLSVAATDKKEISDLIYKEYAINYGNGFKGSYISCDDADDVIEKFVEEFQGGDVVPGTENVYAATPFAVKTKVKELADVKTVVNFTYKDTTEGGKDASQPKKKPKAKKAPATKKKSSARATNLSDDDDDEEDDDEEDSE